MPINPSEMLRTGPLSKQMRSSHNECASASQVCVILWNLIARNLTGVTEKNLKKVYTDRMCAKKASGDTLHVFRNDWDKQRQPCPVFLFFSNYHDTYVKRSARLLLWRSARFILCLAFA